MDLFQEIFTPPESPTPEYNPREDILNQIRQMEDGERRDIRAQQFINQFQPDGQEQGSVGGCSSEVPDPSVNPTLNPVNPANFQIVNEYNSFNLANIIPPIASKWKQPDNLLDKFRKFKHSCLCILMVPCVTSPVGWQRKVCYLYRLDQTAKIFMTISIYPHTKQMMWTMYYNVSRSFASLFAISEWPDLSSPRFLNVRERILIHSITEY